jgi:diguanylate cyclase (GGDEF)-like protein
MLKKLWNSADPSVRLVAPLAALAIIVIGLLNLSIMEVANRADQQGAAWEKDFITGGLKGRLSRTVDTQVERLARTNPYDLAAPTGASRIIVLNSDGQALLRHTGPDAVALRDSVFVRLGAPALQNMRSAVSREESNIPVGMATVWLGGEPQLFIAVQSVFPDPRAKNLTILASTSLRELVSAFATDRHLANAHLVPLNASVPKEASVAPVLIHDMPPSVGLAWKGMRIGRQTLVRGLPIIWGVTLALLIAGALLLRRSLRLAQNLMSSEAHAHHLALHDPMTGLGNRALFADRLEHTLALRGRGQGLLAVACIDLDRFKHVNDTLGHQAGDAMIKEAAQRMSAVTRQSDTVVRMGGDEFAIILYPVADQEGLEALCARLTAALSARLDLPSGQAALSASIGVAIVSDTMDGPDALRQADLALYRAKQNGRGCYALFEPQMDESQRQRQLIEQDLREALRTTALEVHYQPQYTARGVLEGVEALVRWNHPTRGQIGPDYFVPIAEEAGLIHELGDFVLAQAIGASARWPDLRVAINVSPIQLQQSSFVPRCLELTKAAGISPARIELEITEGVLLENDPRIQAALRALREAGFKIALDDFGTGYSSLNYLSAYAVDKIKIDRSFIRNLGAQGGDGDKIVRAIIKLGRALGMTVTAEGVETEDQRSRLVAAGCHSLQGFYHGRPGVEGAIDDLIKLASRSQAA